MFAAFPFPWIAGIYRAFDWDADEGWRAHRANIEIPPGKEALEVKCKAKVGRYWGGIPMSLGAWLAGERVVEARAR